MITAVDSSILFDCFLPDPRYGPASKRALEGAYQEGSLILSEVVYAELGAFFEGIENLEETLLAVSLRLVPSSKKTLFEAGQYWKRYRRERRDRKRVLADFCVASHALHHADRLLTRDRGFYRRFFKNLKVISP